MPTKLTVAHPTLSLVYSQILEGNATFTDWIFVPFENIVSVNLATMRGSEHKPRKHYVLLIPTTKAEIIKGLSSESPSRCFGRQFLPVISAPSMLESLDLACRYDRTVE
jgi:hypothetical protein